MKEKRLGVYVTSGIAIFSFILSALFYFRLNCLSEEVKSFCFTVASGSMASAVVTMIIYSFEYRSQKRRLLEEYWHYQIRLNKKIFSIKYYKPIIETKDVSVPSDELDKILKSYSAFEEVDYHEADRMYADISFFRDGIGRKRQHNIFNKIHSPMHDVLKKVKAVNAVYKKYSQGEETLSAVVEKVNDVQKIVFKEEIISENGSLIQKVHRNYFYNMDWELETLRAEIIYKCVPERIEEEELAYSKKLDGTEQCIE